jgi:hypothetical protein
MLVACEEQAATGSKRMEVKQINGTSIQIVPAAGQHPYCLVYTIAETGKVRQLTMGRYNESWKCEAGKPIGGRTFRIPRDEGKVRVLGIFSDQRLAAGPVSDQLFETVRTRKRNGGIDRLNILDMRLPGKVNTEWAEFVPGEETPVVTGAEIGQGGEVVGGDAGTRTPGAPADAGTSPAPMPSDTGTKPAAGATDAGTR